MCQDNISCVMRKPVYAICEQKKGTDQPPSMHFTLNLTALCYMYIYHIPLWIVKMHQSFLLSRPRKKICVFTIAWKKFNRVGRLENVFILLKFLYGDNREEKKTLGSAAKNGDGRMIVNKNTFLWPYTFWFASFISFGLVRPRKNIVVTCVSGSLLKTIRIGRSILFSESAPNIYGM